MNRSRPGAPGGDFEIEESLSATRLSRTLCAFMDEIVQQFISAVRQTYPVSVAENLRHERPDLIESLRRWDDEIESFEKKYSVRYPRIARDLLSHCNETFIFFKSPTYRHLTNPVSAADALDTMLDFAEDRFFYQNKIPIFDADGNYDLLDLERYDINTDDCPVLFDNHEEPGEHLMISDSFRKYLKHITAEILSGDDPNDYSPSEYVTRMQSRGTDEIKILAEA